MRCHQCNHQKFVDRCCLTVACMQGIQNLLDHFQLPAHIMGEDSQTVSLFVGCDQAIGMWLDACNANGVSSIAFTSAAQASATRPTDTLENELALAKSVQNAMMWCAHGAVCMQWPCPTLTITWSSHCWRRQPLLPLCPVSDAGPRVANANRRSCCRGARSRLGDFKLV